MKSIWLRALLMVATLSSLSGCWYPGREQEISKLKARVQTLDEEIREFDSSKAVVQKHKDRKAKLEAELRALKSKRSP